MNAPNNEMICEIGCAEQKEVN